MYARLLTQVKYVKGIDLSPAEVREAERRYKELVARSGERAPAAVLVTTDTLLARRVVRDTMGECLRR